MLKAVNKLQKERLQRLLSWVPNKLNFSFSHSLLEQYADKIFQYRHEPWTTFDEHFHRKNQEVPNLSTLQHLFLSSPTFTGILSTEIRQLVVFSLILPHFDRVCLVYGGLSGELEAKLKHIMNCCCVRCIFRFLSPRYREPHIFLIFTFFSNSKLPPLAPPSGIS